MGINIFDLLEAKNNIAHTLVHPRFFSEVSPSSYLGQTMGLAGNSKLIYEVCDSKNEKSTSNSINLVHYCGLKSYIPCMQSLVSSVVILTLTLDFEEMFLQSIDLVRKQP